MRQFRTAIRNSTVVEATVEEGGLYLSFDGGWRLVVVNPHILEGATSLGELVGQRVLEFEERAPGERLRFDRGASVVVDLHDGAFVGPEAMALYGPDDLIVVWN